MNIKKKFLCLFTSFLGMGYSGAQTLPQDGRFELLSLPYATDALAPVIGRRTIELHHGKHLAGYVAKLNELVRNTPYEGLALEEVVRLSKGPVFNNAAQMLNHNLYFLQFSPSAAHAPKGELEAAIVRQWGSLAAFQHAFEQAGTGLFGSGWVWLSRDKDGLLVISALSNAGNPITLGMTPLLGFDVWEHAYYVDYENRRADHLHALWDIVDWNVVQQRFEQGR